MTLMKMVGYLTTDFMNATTAEALAARYGLGLEVVEPRDLPHLERQRPDLVVDWDFIPADYRAQLLKTPAVNIVAVHGYNLGDGLAGSLPRRGVICSRRLDHYLFQALAAPVIAAGSVTLAGATALTAVLASAVGLTTSFRGERSTIR